MNENQPLKPGLADARGVFSPKDAASEALQTQLDSALDRLALRYARLPAQAQAEQDTLEALKTFTRALSDDELEWLAAAGPGGPMAGTAPNDPTDPKNLGRPKR